MKTLMVAALATLGTLTSATAFAADSSPAASLTETIKSGQRAAAIEMIAKKPARCECG